MVKLRRELNRVKEENDILKRPSVSSRRTLGALTVLVGIPVYGRLSRAILRHGHGPRSGGINQRVLQLATPRRKPAKQGEPEVTRGDKSHTRRERYDLRQSPDPSGLQACGIRCGGNRVACLMRLHEVHPKQVRRYKRTTDSKHDLPVAENHLDR